MDPHRNRRASVSSSSGLVPDRRNFNPQIQRADPTFTDSVQQPSSPFSSEQSFTYQRRLTNQSNYPYPAGSPAAKVACVPCRNRHIACDQSRPCKKCFTSGRPELCRDEISQKKRALLSAQSDDSSAATPRQQSPLYVSPQKVQEDLPTELLGTMILSTSQRIARVDEEACTLLKSTPGILLQKPLPDFIHQEDRSMFVDMCQRVLRQRQPEIPACPVPVPQTTLYSMPMEFLTRICPRTATHSGSFRIRGGRRAFMVFEIILYISDAFGVDISREETYGNMCMVASFRISTDSSYKTRLSTTIKSADTPPQEVSTPPRFGRSPFSSTERGDNGASYNHQSADRQTQRPVGYGNEPTPVSAAPALYTRRRNFSEFDTSYRHHRMSSCSGVDSLGAPLNCQTAPRKELFSRDSTAQGLFGMR